MKYSGSDWLAPQLVRWGKPPMSELGAAAADIVGAVYRGIYHVHSSLLEKAEWDHRFMVRLTVYGELATFDADLLTTLVVLAHDRCVRVAVEPRNMRHLRLCFSPRKGREGHLFERHPSIEAALLRVRREFGLEVRATE